MFRTYVVLVFSFLLIALTPSKEVHAARGRDYVMATSGTLSVVFLGMLVYQAITASDKPSTSPSPDALDELETQAEKAVEQLGREPSDEDEP